MGGEGLGPGCLSQCWPASFEVEGTGYHSAEQFMMAEKARLFGDEEMRIQIMETLLPGQARALGRAVRGFSDGFWQERRLGIVLQGNREKFIQNEALGAYLLGTGDDILVEASPTDTVWGIGLEGDHEDSGYPHKWKGLNLLGFALMEVRDLLRGLPGKEPSG